MLKKFGLAAAMLCACALPALAQTTCQAPVAPVIPDAHSATQAQMVAAATGTRTFIAQSDSYQQCMVDFVKAQKDLATQNKTPFDASIETNADAQVAANQQAKQKAGDDINAAIGVYKAAHPQ